MVCVCSQSRTTDRPLLGKAVGLPAAVTMYLFVAGTAAAQTEAEPDPGPVVLGPITVTARQIEEPIQTVPFGVTAVTREDLQDSGIDDTRDLYRSIPNFNYTDVGLPQSNLLNIRGVGSSSTFLSPSVTYYVDGVPLPARAFDQQFLDVERIEVLRGPQGTLFGQNAQAGAVNIITAEPTDRPTFEVGGEYGTFDAYRVTATASGPIANRAAGRLHGTFYDRDGDIRNFLFTDPITVASDDRTIRERTLAAVSGRLRADLGEDTSASLAGRFQRDRRQPTTGLLLDDPDFPRNALDPRPENDVDAGGGALTVEHFVGDIRLTSITGFQAYDLSQSADITDGFLAGATSGRPPFVFSPANSLRRIDEDLTQWSQEVRGDGETAGGLLWVGGISGLYSDFTSVTDITSPRLPNGTYSADVERFNLAAFGELTIPVTDRLRLIGGLRFTHETNDFNGQFTGRAGGAPGVAAFTESGETEDTLVTGRVALSYDVTPDLTAFATIGRGAKAGGFPFFNQSAAFGIPSEPFESSSTLSYETGVRGTLLASRLGVSASLFFNDTTDEQLFTFNPIAGRFEAENADTRTYGAELELTGRPIDGLSLSGSVALLQTEVTEAATGSAVRDGNEVPYAPEVAASLAGAYLLPAISVGLPGDFVFRAEYQYVGSREIDPANTARLDSYDLVNLRVGLNTERFDIYAFGRNLIDEEFAVSGFLAGTSPSGSAVIGGVPGSPRTFGVGARIRF